MTSEAMTTQSGGSWLIRDRISHGVGASEPVPHALKYPALHRGARRGLIGVKHQASDTAGEHVNLDPGGILEVPGKYTGFLQRCADSHRAIAAQYDGPCAAQGGCDRRCPRIITDQTRIVPKRRLWREVAAEAMAYARSPSEGR